MKKLEKKDIVKLLKEASVKWNVYMPQKYPGGDVLIAALPKDKEQTASALQNLALGNEDTIVSQKDIFFPQLESMLSFKSGKIEETVDSSPKLLFGMKPCDLKGMLFADEFFKRNFEDKYYLSRIKERLVIVIGCLAPPRPGACFCTSAKTGPFADAGFDLQLVETGDSYLVEVGTEKGREFMEKHKTSFADSADDESVIAQIKKKAAEAVDLKVDFQKALELMAKTDFMPEEIYKRISERCVYCGACLYACPTCTCFNVFDNTKNNEGQRLRNWDACVFEGYTREASGHNPRQEKWVRTSRRYEHKLKYDQKITGQSGCVGCGRCLARCPVNIGISKFIKEITENGKVL